MSYSIDLKIPEGASDDGSDDRCKPDLPSPTYNLTPIFHLALTGDPMPDPDVTEGQAVVFKQPTSLRGLRVLSGRKASDTVAQIMVAIASMRSPEKRAAFLALEPENRWGTLHDAISVMDTLRLAALGFPDRVWEIS